MIKYRLFNPNVSMLHRAMQLTNAFIEYVLSSQLNLVHIVEYPKCGGSWIRNMIRTYRNTDLFLNNRLLRKNDVLMSHCLYTRRIKKPIIVVRDPRDMYVSFYYYQISYHNRDTRSPLFQYFQHNPEIPVKADFYEYLKAKLLYPTHPWFFFSQFIDDWFYRPAACIIRYEDCLKEPETQLIHILRFVNENVSLDHVQKTIKKTSFEAITKDKYGKKRKSGEVDNTKFHRKGISGDWKSHFNEASCLLIEKFEGPALRRLGYEKESGWEKKSLEY